MVYKTISVKYSHDEIFVNGVTLSHFMQHNNKLYCMPFILIVIKSEYFYVPGHNTITSFQNRLVGLLLLAKVFRSKLTAGEIK